jgi:hypothetical protein
VNEEAQNGVVIGRSLEARERQESLDLGGKDEMVLGHGIIEWLDAKPIPGAEEPAARSVPDAKSEHAVQPLQARFAPFEIALEQHLGVGARVEVAAPALELRPELLVVVDLTIEYDPGAARARRHRLKAAVGEIQNCQPAVAQRNASRRGRARLAGVAEKGGTEAVRLRPTDDEALAVRAPVGLNVVHPLQDAEVDRASIQSHDACNAAHPALLRWLSVGRDEVGPVGLSLRAG